jgi:uncharacterized membrane protein
MKTRFVLLAGIVVVCACADVEAPSTPVQYASIKGDDYEMIDLGVFGNFTQAFGIDDAERVFGRYGTASGVQRSFRWTADAGFEDLGELEGKPFQFLRTNKHGVLTGWVPTDVVNFIRPAVFLPHSGFQYVDDAQHGGQAWGVNKHGQVVGSRFIPGSASEGFLWSEHAGLNVIPIVFPPGTPRGFNATDINDRGVVLGTVQVLLPPPTGFQTSVFLWDEHNGTRVLPKLSTGNVGVTYINEDNTVVGAAESRAPLPGERRANPLSFTPGDVPVHAWRWTEDGGLQDLGTLGGKHSVAWAVDEQGNAYGWAMNAAGVQRAVKWTVDGRKIELGTLGGYSQTGGVNKHGAVPGQSVTPGGQAHAMLYLPRK